MSDDSIFRKPDGDSWRDIPEDKMFQPGKVFFPKKVDIGFTLVEFEGEAGSLVCPMIRYTDENGKEATIGFHPDMLEGFIAAKQNIENGSARAMMNFYTKDDEGGLPT